MLSKGSFAFQVSDAEMACSWGLVLWCSFVNCRVMMAVDAQLVHVLGNQLAADLDDNAFCVTKDIKHVLLRPLH